MKCAGCGLQRGKPVSERNGDRARFQKDRKRKLLRRQRVRAVVMGRRKQVAEHATAAAASLAMQDEGGPTRTGQ